MAGKRRIHKGWWVLGIVLLFLGILAVYLHWPVDNRIIISRETTYIDGPLNRDGTVNYVAALDAMLAEGVTSENNGAPLLIRAMGPAFLNPATRFEVIHRMGMDDLPADGNYFQSWPEWARAHPKWFTTASQPAVGRKLADLYHGRDSNAGLAPWKEAEDPAVAAWLGDNEGPMRRIIAASRKSRFYVPLVSNGKLLIEVAGNLQLLSIRDMPDVFAARTMMRIGQGDCAGAREDIFTQARLGRLLARCPATVGSLLGRSCEAAGWREGLVLLSASQVTPEVARSMIAEEESLPAPPPAREWFVQCERFVGLDAVMSVSRGSTLSSSGPLSTASASNLDWNLVLREMNAAYDQQAAALSLPAGPARHARAEELKKEQAAWFRERSESMTWTRAVVSRLSGRLGRRLSSEMVSGALNAILTPNIMGAVDEAESEQAWSDFFRIACALHAYRIEKGRYPATIEELSPAYLKQAPLDRFSDKPLIYKPKADGYVLHSVGPDGKDDGGKGDDIVVEMPRKTVGGE